MGLGFLLLVAPSAGQAPPPACSSDQQLRPDQFDISDILTGDSVQSVTQGHRAQVSIFLPQDPRSLDPSGLRISGPPGVTLTANASQSDSSTALGDFIAGTPGAESFTATWTQLTQADGTPCTGTLSRSVTVTAPTKVKARKQLYYGVRHRIGQPGGANEFVITSYALASTLHGDLTPIRIVARAVQAGRRPSASTRPATLIFDPLSAGTRIVRSSTKLIEISVRPKIDPSSSPNSEYDFAVAVSAYPHHGRGHAHRGVDVRITQGSRTLTRYHLVTSCDTLHGGLFCFPTPKGAITGK
jgi:hypothetical protein